MTRLPGTNHGQQISQRLAGSRAGFDDQVAFLCQRLLDGLRHLQLSAAEFVRRVSLREQATGRKEVVERSGLFLSGSDGLGGGSHRNLYNTVCTSPAHEPLD